MSSRQPLTVGIPRHRVGRWYAGVIVASWNVGQKDPHRRRESPGLGSRPAGCPPLPSVVATAAQSPVDPAFRIRLELPFAALRDAGIASVEFVPYFSAEEAFRVRAQGPATQLRVVASARRRTADVLRRSKAETVIVQRRVDVAPSLTVERRATRGRKVILDVDDAVWLNGAQTGQTYLAGLTRPGRKAAWLARRASTVIAGNEYLAEWLGQWAARVRVIPCLVDTTRYKQRIHADSDRFTICWIGSSTTQVHLQKLGSAFDRAALALDRPLRLIAVGGRPPRLSRGSVDERSWSVAEEQRVLAAADVGVMPASDTPFGRGKCAYKAIQYMAAGLPVIADDVGVARTTIADGGYVVRGDAGWVDALVALAGDHELRQRVGDAGRRHVEQHHSIDRWLPVYRDILTGD
jgi:glycosyltransferase involved in cell wall biosynthesis